CGEPGVLFPADGDPDLSRYGLGYIALQIENVPQVSIIGFRPKMLVGRSANQLRVDANPAALPDYGSFDNSVYVEGFSDLWHRELRILEAHHGGAGCHAEIVYPRKGSDQSLGHSVGEIVLRRVAREVFERQYSERLDCRLLCASGAGIAVQQEADDEKQQ